MKRVLPVFLMLFFSIICFAKGNYEEKAPTDFESAFVIPKRIVSLAPAVTEILFAIGSETQIAARTDFCNWPPKAAKLPSVGGFDGKAISLEKILSFEPDMVCLADVMHNHLVQPLEQMGIRVFISSAESIAQVFEEIQALAKITDHMAEGESCIKEIQLKLNAAKEIALGKSDVTVYWEINEAPFFTCGASSFITEILTIAGGVNIFSDVDQSYPQVSTESIIVRVPEVILYPDYTGKANADFILQRKGWQQIPAVKNKRVYPVDSDLFSRAGPRIGQMTLDLAQILHTKPVFEAKN